MRLNSAGKNPCGSLAGIRDRDRRPCEGSSKASATQSVVTARAASRLCRGAHVRSAPSIFVTDTFCAKPGSGSPFLPDACAMISHGVSNRVGFVFVPRMTGHSTPMTGIDRSNLSYRTILIFFVLLGAPMAALSTTLEDSAKELARKIAAALPARDDVTVEVRNISSLTPSEANRVSQALNNEMQNQGFRTPVNGGMPIRVRITLSENLKGFLWGAEILQGDASRAVLMAVARSVEDRTFPSTMPVVLHSEKLWEGPEHVLDVAAMVTPDGNKLLVLLVPEGLIVRRTEGRPAVRIPMNSHPSYLRSPDDRFLGLEAPLIVFRDGDECTVSLEPAAVRECHPAPKYAGLTPVPGRGQATKIRSGCGTGNQVLTTGPGDYSQPDTVQAFEWQHDTPVAVSEEMNFPGPVLVQSIFEAPSATAIVRNLQTGNYEAYRLSISCAQ